MRQGWNHPVWWTLYFRSKTYRHGNKILAQHWYISVSCLVCKLFIFFSCGLSNIWASSITQVKLLPETCIWYRHKNFTVNVFDIWWIDTLLVFPWLLIVNPTGRLAIILWWSRFLTKPSQNKNKKHLVKFFYFSLRWFTSPMLTAYQWVLTSCISKWTRFYRNLKICFISWFFSKQIDDSN